MLAVDTLGWLSIFSTRTGLLFATKRLCTQGPIISISKALGRWVMEGEGGREGGPAVCHFGPTKCTPPGVYKAQGSCVCAQLLFLNRNGRDPCQCIPG